MIGMCCCLLEGMSVTEMHEFLLTKLYETCEVLVPMRKSNPKRCRIPRDRRILFKTKSTLYKRLAKDPNNMDILTKIRSVDKSLCESHEREQKLCEINAINAIRDN